MTTRVGPARIRLEVKTGPAAGLSIEIENEIEIGRQGADVAIDDPEISRRHVIVRRRPDGLVVEDLGSVNGTFVNGTRVSVPVKLASNATLRIGRTEIGVEVTRAGEGASADREEGETPASDSPVASQPDVTVQRPIQPADATAARAVVPPPPVAAPRPIPRSPDPSPAPPVIPTPDVTAPRPIPRSADPSPAPPVIPAPDVTAPRPIPEAPAAARGREKTPASRRALTTIVGAAVVIAAIVVIIVATSGSSAKTRQLSGNLLIGTVALNGAQTQFAGVQSGTIGQATVSFDQQASRAFRFARLVSGPVSATVVSSFGDGTITSRLTATVTQGPTGVANYHGHATIVGGTGAYKGATGSYTLSGTVTHSTAFVARIDEDTGRFTINGSARY